MYGLHDSDIRQIVDLFRSAPEIEEAIIFGSRAIGRHRHGSDIDLALNGEKLTSAIMSRLSEYLNEETNMPYRFDPFRLSDINNQDLVDHIGRVGVVIYGRATVSAVQDPEQPYTG